MSGLLRFLGLAGSSASAVDRDATASVRQIAARLDGLDAPSARFLAAFAYVLARLAHADLSVDEEEAEEIRRRVVALSGLGEEQARVAVEIAQSQVEGLGGTANYRVTREFRAISSREQRVQLLQCLYAVAAADGTISTAESAEIVRIAEELGFAREEAIALRVAWRDQLAEFK